MRGLGRNARTFVLRMMPKGSICAEIGVWRGDFSQRVLRSVRPAKLHLIDPWTFASDQAYSKAWYGGGLARNQKDMDELYEKVVRRFEAAIQAGVVEVHRCTSTEAAAHFPDEYFDWIYVDGNHLYEFVLRDLELFDPKVKDGGLIAGDDYGLVGWWNDGVTRAVDQFVAERGCEVVSLRRNQYVLRVSRS